MRQTAGATIPREQCKRAPSNIRLPKLPRHSTSQEAGRGNPLTDPILWFGILCCVTRCGERQFGGLHKPPDLTRIVPNREWVVILTPGQSHGPHQTLRILGWCRVFSLSSTQAPIEARPGLEWRLEAEHLSTSALFAFDHAFICPDLTRVSLHAQAHTKTIGFT